jgi:hypothetical protein
MKTKTTAKTKATKSKTTSDVHQVWTSVLASVLNTVLEAPPATPAMKGDEVLDTARELFKKALTTATDAHNSPAMREGFKRLMAHPETSKLLDEAAICLFARDRERVLIATKRLRSIATGEESASMAVH